MDKQETKPKPKPNKPKPKPKPKPISPSARKDLDSMLLDWD